MPPKSSLSNGITVSPSGLEELLSGSKRSANAESRPLRLVADSPHGDTTTYKNHLLGSAQGMRFTSRFHVLVPVCLLTLVLLFTAIFRSTAYGRYSTCLEEGGVAKLLDSSNSSYISLNETSSELLEPSELLFYCIPVNATSDEAAVNSFSTFVFWLDAMPLYGLVIWSFVIIVRLLLQRLSKEHSILPGIVLSQYESIPSSKDSFEDGDPEGGSYSRRARASTMDVGIIGKNECSCGVPILEDGTGHSANQRDTIVKRYHLHMLMELGQKVCPCPPCHAMFESAVADNAFKPDQPVPPMLGIDETAPFWFSPRALFNLFYKAPAHQTELYVNSRHGVQIAGFIVCGYLVSLMFAIAPTAMQVCRSHLPLEEAAGMVCPFSPIQSFSQFSGSCDSCSIAVISLSNAAFGWFVGAMFFIALANGWQPSDTTASSYQANARELYESHPNAVRILSAALKSAKEDKKLQSHSAFMKWRFGIIASMATSILLFFALYAGSLIYLLFGRSSANTAEEIMELFSENPAFWAGCVLAVISSAIAMVIILRCIYVEAITALKRPLVEQIHLTSLLDPSILFTSPDDRPIAKSPDEVANRFDEDRAYIADWLRARRFHYRFIANFELKSVQAFLVGLVVVSVTCLVLAYVNVATQSWDIDVLLFPLSVLMIYIAIYAAMVLVTYLTLIIKLLGSDTAQLLVLHAYSYLCYSREFIYRVEPSVGQLVGAEYKAFQAFIMHVSSMLSTDYIEPHAVIFGFTVHKRYKTLAQSYLFSAAASLVGILYSQLA